MYYFSTCTVFFSFLAEEDDEKRILELTSCVRQLPPHNVAIMKHLCLFLREVSFVLFFSWEVRRGVTHPF
jgi:hypothetical protein